MTPVSASKAAPIGPPMKAHAAETARPAAAIVMPEAEAAFCASESWTVAAGEVARMADAAVVGSSLVERIAGALDEQGRPRADLVESVLAFAKALGDGVRGRTEEGQA